MDQRTAEAFAFREMGILFLFAVFAMALLVFWANEKWPKFWTTLLHVAGITFFIVLYAAFLMAVLPLMWETIMFEGNDRIVQVGIGLIHLCLGVAIGVVTVVCVWFLIGSMKRERKKTEEEEG